MPEIVVAHIAGSRLAELIEITPQILAPLAQHAVAAWNETRFGTLQSNEKWQTIKGGFKLNVPTILKIYLEPAHQMSWLPGMLPHDHVPTTDIERALVNLTLSGEIV